MQETSDDLIVFPYDKTPGFSLEGKKNLESIRDHIHAESSKPGSPRKDNDNVMLDQYCRNPGALLKPLIMVDLWFNVMQGVEFTGQSAAGFADYSRREMALSGPARTFRTETTINGSRKQKALQGWETSGNIHLSSLIAFIENRQSHMRVVTTNGLTSLTESWRDGGCNGYFWSYAGPISLARDTSVNEHRNYQPACFVNGQSGREWSKLPPHERRPQAMQQIAKMFNVGANHEAFRTIEMFDQIWMHEQYIIVTCTLIAFLEHAIEAQSIPDHEAPKSYHNESCLTTREMTNRKRTYIPKVRGIRYRFNHDVTPKSKSPRKRTAPQEEVAESCSEYTEPDHGFEAVNIAELPFHRSEDMNTQGFFAISVQGGTVSLGSDFGSPEEFVDPISQLPILYYDAELSHPTTPEDSSLSIIRSPHFLEPWKEYLLEHFSRKIAPEMAVIDDSTNGWRHIILPVAHVDALVMDAVLSASAFHISATLGANTCNASRFYTQAITRLQQRQDLTMSNRDRRNSTFLGILVLLVTVMVNGYSDFPLIFKLLESALLAVGGEEQLSNQGELGVFLRRQIRK
ncbi:hypothetical protein LTR24_004632 [Lithohypha guttulata]|uniref:Transcription factor domain-containing protein n=1 Tax=Lithohypha guttulata TaxID=1690604 RepID=A0ABR0KBM1_9EURO|nr:hypothetical protein LTR24_004632 [Lithohypha guttulata]